MMLLNNVFKVILADVTSNPFLFNDYKKGMLQFLVRVSATMSAGPKGLRPRLAL